MPVIDCDFFVEQSANNVFGVTCHTVDSFWTSENSQTRSFLDAIPEISFYDDSSDVTTYESKRSGMDAMNKTVMTCQRSQEQAIVSFSICNACICTFGKIPHEQVSVLISGENGKRVKKDRSDIYCVADCSETMASVNIPEFCTIVPANKEDLQQGV